MMPRRGSRSRPLAFAAAFLVIVAGGAPRAGARDLAAYAGYEPHQRVSGTLRSAGNNHMAALMKRWEAGFKKFHPNVRFADTLEGTATGIYGLEMRTADVAVMGRAINPFERYGIYERSWTYPVEIEVATGSVRTAGASPALAIFVNAGNPLAKLTLKQLDGIFGAQRGGGWEALSWIEAAARPATDDIRTWGQLGLRGAWSGRSIHVYGPANLGPGVVTFFQTKVLHGGAMWNEDLREYADRGKMIAALSKDRYGIAYAPLAYAAPGVKAIALAETSGGPSVALTQRTLADRTYPLARPVYIDYTIDDERSEIAEPRVDPKIREFLRYVLSRQGQEQVARDGLYIALPGAVAQRQLKKLDATGTPPEKLLVVPAAPAPRTVKIRLSVDEDPIVPRLAQSLGYFEREGVEIVPVKVDDFAKEDYLLQKPLIDGHIDASYHWFNHAVFGARHNLPIEAVMVFNDAPGMTVMVANRARATIRSAADFKGKRVAEGAEYGTKSLLTSYLATEAGLPSHSYTPVMLRHDGRQQAVIGGLRAGRVDVMTFQEPITSTLLRTGMVTKLYDLNSGAATAKVLGAPWPAQSLLMSPAFVKTHPEAAQRLVNAFVRTMRFINSHSVDQIVEKLPPTYFDGKNRQAAIEYIRNTLPSYAKGDYSFTPAEVKLVVKSIDAFGFDKSVEGRWRGTAENPKVDAGRLYTNRFVRKAMREIK